MSQQKKNLNRKNSNGANLGFEEKLWQAADKMRSHMDPAEYKHVVLGLIFLKYISDAFEERRRQLEMWTAEPSSEYYVSEEIARYGVIEDRDEYLSPNGIAGFVLANGSMSSNQSGEGGIRKNIIEADLVDCMIALPGQLFYTTPIPACLWFIARNKKNSKFRDRKGQTLFIDTRKMGYLVDRIHREFSDEEISRIARTYHAWRSSSPRPFAGEGKGEGVVYKNIPGFCKSASIEEIKAHGYVLTPGRYVGAEDVEDDDEPFDEEMKRLTAKLEEQFVESEKLEALIKRNLRGLGFGN